MDENQKNVIHLLNTQRKFYEKKQIFHYINFAAFSLILMLDFIIIIYVRAITLNAYAWAGIMFLFVLMGIEAIQYKEFKLLKESVDDLYLRGSYDSEHKH